MNIKEFLNKYDVTHDQMARALNISSIYVSHLANGKKPSAKLALRIEEVTFGKVKRSELLPDLFGETAFYGVNS